MKMHLWRLIVGCCVMVVSSTALAQTTVEARSGWNATIKDLERKSASGEVTTANLASVFTPDVLFVESSGRVSANLVELERNILHDLKQVTINSWSYDTNDFGSSGTLAYGSGISTAVFTDKSDGKQSTQRTRFLILMRQDPDKRWRIFREFWAPMKGDAK